MKKWAYLTNRLLKWWHAMGWRGAIWLVRLANDEEVEMEITEVSSHGPRRNNEIALGEAIRCVKANTLPRIQPLPYYRQSDFTNRSKS